MSSNKLKVQAFRANDLSEDTGKQFELGKSWCDFFEIDKNVGEVTFKLNFKPLSNAHESLANRQIDLQLSALTARNDRKAYANGARSGHSAIKEFFIEDLHLTVANNIRDYFAVYKASESNYYLYYVPKLLHDNFIKLFESITPKVTINRAEDRGDNKFHNVQQIFYGAPGTGKSHKIKNDENVKKAEEKNLVFRTTFHPDSDYSTFVGAYKPTMDKRAVRNVAGDIVKNTEKEEVYEDCIIYSFVPQAFLQAYVAAWNNPDDKVFLVIEEINRGNCAQIFGDLFQLLDRDCDGFSEYPIMADKDLAKYLNSKDENGKDVLTNKDGIKDGKLRLPSNLYIWATMNTSDQSLFPIDSAFKRRWDWKYLPIENADKGWKIQVNGHEYDWYEFLETINREVYDLTHSEDKQLGYFFAKAKNEVIDAETLVNKVYFYLWTDVFKDYDIESQKAFKKPNSNEAIAFKDFFVKGGVNEEMAEQVLVNLGLERLNKSGELFG